MAANGKSNWSKANWSKTWTFFEDEWHEGNVPIMGPRTHAAWLASCVFDGARAFEGVTPDLDLHCARINDSAPKLFLKALVPQQTWMDLVAEGRKKFDPQAALYVRPMYWAEQGDNVAGVAADPDSTRWCLCLYETSPLDATGIRSRCRRSAGRPSNACRSMPRPAAFIPTTDARWSKRARAASTIA